MLRDTSGDTYSHPSGAEEGDLVETRRYGPGDPCRLILWKTYARTRRLLVRVPERALAPARNVVAYLVAGDGDEPTASIAREFIEAAGIDVVFQADGAERAARDREEGLEQLVDSVEHRSRGAEGLEPLLATLGRERLDGCVLFVPGRMGAWFERVRWFVAGLSVRPTLVTSVDGTVEEGRPGPLSRLLHRRPTAGGASLEGLPELYDALSGLGGTVLVVHSPTGRLLGQDSIDTLRAP